VTQSH